MRRKLSDERGEVDGVALFFLGSVALLTVVAILIALIIGSVSFIKGFSRSQARSDAHNRVSLTSIQIQNQRQYAKVIAAQNQVVKERAYQRYLESVGVRSAQDEIARTLTPLYVQYEAIKAEQSIAESGSNNTVVYVPSGEAGVPVITARAGTGK